MGAPHPACRAPFASMRLSPSGQVYVCGPNWTHAIGSVAKAGLRSIWEGEEVSSLRAAMVEHDFSLGCDECAADAMGPLRSTTHAAAYDRYDIGRFEWPQRVEFALSNTCNLQCVQCTGELSSAIRAKREKRAPLVSPYDDAFFEELSAFLPHIRAAEFVGGEPFLTLENRRVWDELIALPTPPRVRVTTNGTIWNDRVEHYLRALRMDVSMSIDGVSAATNDRIRVGSDIAQVRVVRDRIIEVVSEYGGDFGVNHCLMRQNWHELPAFLQECESLGVPAYVARVVHPSSSSLLAMEASELSHVVTVLRSHDDELQRSLVLNLDVWDRSLGMLASQLERAEGEAARPAAGAPVELRSHDPLRPRDQIAAADELVARWSSRPAIALSALNGRIIAESIPEWAQGRLADSWIDGDLTDLLPRFEHLLGTPLTPPITETTDGIQTVRLRAADEAAELELRAHLVSWADGSKTFLEVRVGVLGDLGARGGATASR